MARAKKHQTFAADRDGRPLFRCEQIDPTRRKQSREYGYGHLELKPKPNHNDTHRDGDADPPSCRPQIEKNRFLLIRFWPT